LHRRHPLLPLLAELERDPRARRVTLEPFTRDELAAQLRDILGAEPEAGLVDRLHRRGEGNPLFTEELLAAGLDGRSALPPTLRDALMVRIQRLSEEAQELLRLVAVARTVDHETLAATAHVTGLPLRDALRDAVGAHILAVDAEDRYGFRHALLREAVSDDLLPGERAELHLRLARALETPLSEPGGVHRTAAVAHHYLAAGDQPAALAASVRAATLAESVHAYGEAGALLERALELWDRVPEPEAHTGSTQVLLLERAAEANDAEGDSARMETLLERALELAERDGADPVVSSRLLERLARARWTLNRQDESLATLDRSLELLPAGPSPERAGRLAAKARFLMLMGRFRAAADVATEARDQARTTGATGPEGQALNALGVSQMGLGDVEAGVDALRRAQAIARAANAPFALCSASVNLGDILHLSGRTAEAIAVVEEAHAEVRVALGRDDPWVVLALAEFRFEIGDWETAAALLAGVGRGHQGTTLVNLLLRQAPLALGRGETAVAAETLARAARAAAGSREPQFIGVLAELRATLAARQGALEEARSLVEDGLDALEFCTEDEQRIASLAAAGVHVEAEIAQRARDLGDGAAAGDALARADLLLGRVATVFAGDETDEEEDDDHDGGGEAAPAADRRPVERAYALTAAAERARAAGTPAPEAWDRAASSWAAVGRPYPVAQARWRQAEALVLQGEREAATAVAAEAAETAEALGAAWLAAEIGALSARARLRAAVPAHVPVAAAGAEDPFGLTARERQVLTLVAGGATNREVGARLFMAEKTASVHVSRILTKLDVRSRTEAAAVAHRLGLADG
jgi:DNA-binding CsgD family transcriptional regulator/tetratricopeptide (TPR) repeat protein